MLSTQKRLFAEIANDGPLFRSSREFAEHEAARLLRGLAFTGTHPSFGGGEPLPSEEIVAVLLDGIRRPQEEQSC